MEPAKLYFRIPKTLVKTWPKTSSRICSKFWPKIEGGGPFDNRRWRSKDKPKIISFVLTVFLFLLVFEKSSSWYQKDQHKKTKTKLGQGQGVVAVRGVPQPPRIRRKPKNNRQGQDQERKDYVLLVFLCFCLAPEPQKHTRKLKKNLHLRSNWKKSNF